MAMQPYDTKAKSAELPVIIVAACVAFILVLLVFVNFMQQNNERITQQNTSYVADSGRETSLCLSAIFTNTLHDIDTLAHFESSLIGEGGITEEELGSVSSISPFDSVEFVDAAGVAHRPDGMEVNVSDRGYYLEGMEGRTGIDVVFNSRVTRENMLIFYAPVRQGADGPVVGVLTGHFSEQHVNDLLNSDFFGEKSMVLMIDSAGMVVAASDAHVTGTNYLDSLQRTGVMTAAEMEGFRQALANRDTFGYNMRAEGGPTAAVITPIDDTGWMLVKQFPPAASQAMVQHANDDGRQALITIVAIFAAFTVMVLIFNQLQRRRLKRDVQDKTYTYNAIMTLFKRMVLIDFENKSYRYLDDTSPEDKTIPLDGRYDTLQRHVASLAPEGEEREKLRQEFDLDRLRGRLHQGVEAVSMEYQLTHDSTLNWENVSVVCVGRCADGQARLAVVLSQDVSERKRREESINQAMRDSYHTAMRASQAKTDFLSQMSHDIRTPMNAIIGMTTLARLNTADEAHVNSCLDKISISSNHLLDLVNEVLDLSKIESGKLVLDRKPFNMRHLMEGIEAMFSQQALDKDIALSFDITEAEETAWVEGDEPRLRQVLVNLVGNALKFSDAGDEVHVSVGSEDSAFDNRNMRLYRFVVSDTGHGMSPEFMKEMFEPFAREHDSRVEEVEGTGLGLPIARNIVTLMNGTIQVDSTLGEGTTFTILIGFHHASSCPVPGMAQPTGGVLQVDRRTFEGARSGEDAGGDQGTDGSQDGAKARAGQASATPANATPAASADDTDDATGGSGASGASATADADAGAEPSDVDRLKSEDFHGARVLLVEDNLMNREIAAGLLETMGVTVEKAEDGQIALDRVLATEPGHFALIFMDIQMPVMNGYESMRAMRASGREDLERIPIVMLSANAFVEDIQRSKSEGADDHLAKPIDIKRLAQVLHKHLDEA